MIARLLRKLGYVRERELNARVYLERLKIEGDVRFETEAAFFQRLRIAAANDQRFCYEADEGTEEYRIERVL